VFGRILHELGVPYSSYWRIDALERSSLDSLALARTQVLIIEEVQQMLAGSAWQQRSSFNLIKSITNDLRISILAVGTGEARHAIECQCPTTSSHGNCSTSSKWALLQVVAQDTNIRYTSCSRIPTCGTLRIKRGSIRRGLRPIDRCHRTGFWQVTSGAFSVINAHERIGELASPLMHASFGGMRRTRFAGVMRLRWSSKSWLEAGRALKRLPRLS